ncbi:hypothetical protein ZIOFF_023767 [Zingiber officinale]|uniref:Nucleolar protein 58/56 N-terminal domain-containing protein n=1 Tax=Zingiber officinale TaxID=94328 RepID=A0A8J5LFR1_ZINOF|nr:hypothetical protein ZIOFF_023767 [Zingiber officinale]
MRKQVVECYECGAPPSEADDVGQFGTAAAMLVFLESPAGFALFKVLDEGKLDKVEDLWKELTSAESARKIVKLQSFNKFENTWNVHYCCISAATLLIDSKPSKGLRKFVRPHCDGETLAVAD